MKNITKEKLNELIERTKLWTERSHKDKVGLASTRSGRCKWEIYTINGEFVGSFRASNTASIALHELGKGNPEELVLVTTL